MALAFRSVPEILMIIATIMLDGERIVPEVVSNSRFILTNILSTDFLNEIY